jgi:hypothetical protein
LQTLVALFPPPVDLGDIVVGPTEMMRDFMYDDMCDQIL